MNPRILIAADAALEESYAASELRYILTQLCGVTPNIVTDSEQAMKEDICVGASAPSFRMPTGDGYAVCSENGRIYLAAGSAYGYEAAIGALKSDVQTNGCLREDLSLTGDGAACKTCDVVGENQIRFMTYNVFGWWSVYAKNPPASRQPLQISMIRSYRPDIMAFQEFSTSYRNDVFLAELDKLGYAEVGDGKLLNVNGNNFTPLFYRADIFKVLDSGYLLYSGANDKNTKSVTWAVLEHIGGKKMIAMSTHFMYNADRVDHTETRISNAREMAEIISEIRNGKEEYADIPAIMGGDLNCSYAGGAAPLNALEETLNAAQKAASDAGCAINSFGGHNPTYACYDPQYGVFVTCPSHESEVTSAIDHVFYSGNLSITSFATVTDRFASYASDHSPKLMDFTLGI